MFILFFKVVYRTFMLRDPALVTLASFFSWELLQSSFSTFDMFYCSCLELYLPGSKKKKKKKNRRKEDVTVRDA